MERVKDLPGKVSIRWRLTLTYGALVFAAAAVLLFSVYAIVGNAISEAWPTFQTNLSPTFDAQLQQAMRAFQPVAVQYARDAVLRNSVMALVGVGILALIIGYFVADRALRPVARMTATARKLSESTLAHQRIALEGPSDELKELADTFDAMLTRLNVAFDTQRRFVANASHELRTPSRSTGRSWRSPCRTLRRRRISRRWAVPSSRSTRATRSSSRGCCCSPGANASWPCASRSTSRRSPRRPWNRSRPSPRSTA
ncbi:HAMP domain-containing protein [Nonomuraea antimicrobica]